VLLTFDDDVIDAAGRRVAPRLRPGPSPDLLLACDLTGGALCLRPERVIPGADLGAGAARHALALALAGGDGAGHAHVPLVLRHRASPVERRDQGTEAVDPERRRVRRPVDGEPEVEVIICFRDRADLLRRCVRSLLDVTAYDRLCLRLVDNASTDSATASAVRELAADHRVLVSRDDRPFNFSALNNVAATASDADVLVFLNNDTEVIEAGWIAVLLEAALRPEVGAVAPLLIHADGSVQHAGAAVGVHGFAGHPFAGLAPGRRTPFGSALDGTRNWLAVTAACLMIERWKFQAVGGFDEQFTVAGNDVDLGLRLTAAGHRSLCVPQTRLVHDGSASRDPAHPPAADRERSRERYGDFLSVGDPFYHPALTLSRTDCSLRGVEERLRP
jgi:GT2 family glycosyltransferase